MTYVSGLGKVDNRICMVLEWTLGLKRLSSLLQNQSSLLQRQSTSQGNMETQNHQTFCVSLVLVSFTLIYRAACPFVSETLHDQSFSHI